MNITEDDHMLVIKQCKLQHATSPEEIACFALAYADAKFNAHDPLWGIPLALEAYVVYLATTIYPGKNAHGYRTVGVRVGNDYPPQSMLLPRLMKEWSEAVAEGRLAPEHAYYEFEKIHPFIDGNGRVGHLIWASLMTRQSGRWPKTLPPDIFGEQSRYERERQWAT